MRVHVRCRSSKLQNKKSKSATTTETGSSLRRGRSRLQPEPHEVRWLAGEGPASSLFLAAAARVCCCRDAPPRCRALRRTGMPAEGMIDLLRER